MKKLSIVVFTVFLLACHGNETAENQPTDLDRTNNNDTSAIPRDSINTAKLDSTDSARLYR
jgi:hypothetical protein